MKKKNFDEVSKNLAMIDMDLKIILFGLIKNSYVFKDP